MSDTLTDVAASDRRALKAMRNRGHLHPVYEKILSDRIGPTWFDSHESKWWNRYQQLKGHTAEHGTSNVAALFTAPDGFPLGAWVVANRKAKKYGAAAGRLTDDRIAALEALPGWVWSAQEAKYRMHLEHLANYARDHGHTSMARDFTTADGVTLGRWASEMRASHAGTGRMRLTDTMRTELEQIPGWTWTRDRAASRQETPHTS